PCSRLLAPPATTPTCTLSLHDALPIFLWRNDLNIVVDLSAQQLQGLFRNRCSSSHHFTKVKQCLYQCCWICIDLLSEIREASATTQTKSSALAVSPAYATNYVWCASLCVLITLLTFRLLTTTWCAAWTSKCTGCAAATSTASTWATAESSRCTSASSASWTASWASAATATTRGSGLLWHSCWVRVRRHHSW